MIAIATVFGLILGYVVGYSRGKGVGREIEWKSTIGFLLSKTENQRNPTELADEVGRGEHRRYTMKKRRR